MFTPRVLADDPIHLFAQAGPVWIVLSRDAPTFDSMSLIGRELDAACRQNEVVGFLVQVPGGVKPPDGPVRKLGAEILSRNANAVRCAMVLEGTGFWASATRSVFTAITGLSKGAKTKVFGTVPDSYHWLEQEVGLAPGDLARIVSPLRARPVPA